MYYTLRIRCLEKVESNIRVIYAGNMKDKFFTAKLDADNTFYYGQKNQDEIS